MSKFKIWDSLAINEALKYVIQIKTNIEQLAFSNQIDLVELPHSLVPTEVLYNVAVCYEAMYDKLLKQDLVKTGNLLSDKNNIQ